MQTVGYAVSQFAFGLVPGPQSARRTNATTIMDVDVFMGHPLRAFLENNLAAVSIYGLRDSRKPWRGVKGIRLAQVRAEKRPVDLRPPVSYRHTGNLRHTGYYTPESRSPRPKVAGLDLSKCFGVGDRGTLIGDSS